MQKQSLRHIAQLFIVLILLFGLGAQITPITASPVPATGIVVNSIGDDSVSSTITCFPGSPCTLRAAIETANARPGSGGEKITFNIPTPPYTINIGSALPDLAVAGTIIEGPNFNDSDIVLYGNTNGGFSGLKISANNCAIKNLTITNFGGYGIVVGASATPVTGALITGNKIGDLVPLGVFGGPNYGGIKLTYTSLSIIGGSASGEGNVISGNTNEGILLDSGGPNDVRGNYIGVTSDGTIALPNHTGIYIDGSEGNIIGGYYTGEGNLISGNLHEGINIQGNDTRVMRNYIGTNVSGTIAIANGGIGVKIGNSVVKYTTHIGGYAEGQGNLISGNTEAGIAIVNSQYIDIYRNTIGLNATQNAAIPNRIGITIHDSVNNNIGGNTSDLGNVISGNIQQGILMGKNSNNSYIMGNYIGVNSAGVAFPNGMDGIMVQEAYSTYIGGSDVADQNVIANNGENGIELKPGVYTSVAGNLIFNNAALGIDVWRSEGQQGVTPNDVDESDNIQNFPVITDVSFPTPATVLLQGQVTTLAEEDLDIYFYGNDACDPSGHGEGQVYLGKLATSADGTGQANFSYTLTLPRSLIYFTATAYGPTNGQSEFSACQAPFSVYLPLVMR